MLRNILIALGGVWFLAGVLVWIVYGLPSGAPSMVLSGLLVLGLLFERTIYKPNASKAPGPGWQKTTERFVDDQTGKPVTVYIKPETGERIYVED